MKRALLLVAGWILATGALYLSFLSLDVYWNLFEWKPRWDGTTAGTLAASALAIVAIWALARQRHSRLVRGISLAVCLGLLAVALYAWPAEPLGKGLLGREIASPVWYRGGRVILMSLPCLFWALGLKRRGAGGTSSN